MGPSQQNGAQLRIAKTEPGYRYNMQLDRAEVASIPMENKLTYTDSVVKAQFTSV